MCLFLLLFLFAFSKASEQEMTLFFSKFHSSFIRRDFTKFSFGRDFKQTKDNYKRAPYESFEAINDIGGWEFSYFCASILFDDKDKIIYKGLEIQRTKYSKIFNTFDKLIREYFLERFDIKRTAEYS